MTKPRERDLTDDDVPLSKHEITRMMARGQRLVLEDGTRWRIVRVVSLSGRWRASVVEDAAT